MMKNILVIFVLLIAQFSYAQLDNVIKFSAENWGVTKDVVKIEEAVYFVDNNPKPYVSSPFSRSRGFLIQISRICNP